ncbi:MAG: PIN domain-containing protein [Mangrovibacterium sp.]
MEIADANIILRYLLEDDETLSEMSREIVDNNNIYLPFEVCAEVVYVLEKVYIVPRENIRNALTLLIDYRNISTNDKTVLEKALEIYHIRNIDFVDALLVAYNQITGAIIHSFDKKVNKLCKEFE